MIKHLPALYSVIVTMWWLLTVMVRPETWWLLGFNWFAHTYFIPLVPFLLYALFAKRWRDLVWLCAPMLIFLSLYGAYFRPNLHPPAPNLRVMTYNILCSNKQYADMAEMIRQYAPDLIALQEVPADALPFLDDELSDLYPYIAWGTPVSDHVSSRCSTAVLSKTPFEEQIVLDPGVIRPMVLVETTVDQQPLVFISAHIQPSYWALHRPWQEIPAGLTGYLDEQKQEVNFLERTASQYGTKPVILGCDCNTHEPTQTYRHLMRYWENTAAESGWRFGASGTSVERGTVDRAFTHIDYIMVHGDVSAVATYRIENSAGSDHLPVVADLNIKQ